MRRSRLRTYAPMAKRSDKVEREASSFAAVYREVDQRSEGRCEVVHVTELPGFRCARRAYEHHHLFRPRRSHHTATAVVHVCRGCHDRTEWPFARGRLCYLGATGGPPSTYPMTFFFSVRYASDKFAARRNA